MQRPESCIDLASQTCDRPCSLQHVCSDLQAENARRLRQNNLTPPAIVLDMQTGLQHLVSAVCTVPVHVQWIKRSRRRIHQSFAVWVIVLLMINFSYCRYTCYTARTPSIVYIGLRDSPLPLTAKTVSISEATVSVHQFLSQTRKLFLKRGELSTSYQRQPSPTERISFTTGQWLAWLICIPIDLCYALCHHLTILAVIFCCVMPVAQLLWRLCPSLGVDHLTSAPDQLVMAPLADAICINYVYHMLLAPTVHKSHFVLAAVGINRMDPSTNWSVYPFMSVAIISDLFQRFPIRQSQHDNPEQQDIYSIEEDSSLLVAVPHRR